MRSCGAPGPWRPTAASRRRLGEFAGAFRFFFFFFFFFEGGVGGVGVLAFFFLEVLAKLEPFGIPKKHPKTPVVGGCR